jgi:hypothetical protein
MEVISSRIQEDNSIDQIIVIKPGPAWRVDPVSGPVWVRKKTGKCKKPARPGRPDGSTHDPGDPGKPRRDPTFVMHQLPFTKSKLDP